MQASPFIIESRALKRTAQTQRLHSETKHDSSLGAEQLPQRVAADDSKDRAAIEALIADDFRFTSPRDNALDRATYFSRCWPGSQEMQSIAYVVMMAQGERVFVTYDLRMNDGHSFRNTELLNIRDGKLREAQVFFGWTLPHEAPEGGFL